MASEWLEKSKFIRTVFRYSDHRGSQIDILFSNIKHLFFQPSTSELIVIIHVHLKDPIMIGKKKSKDVAILS